MSMQPTTTTISGQASPHAWLEGPLGQHLLKCEEHLVAQALERVFGFQLLQVGEWGGSSTFVQHSKTLRQGVVHSREQEGVSVVAQPWELPFAADSVDAVILPHTLENNPHPHQILREAHRILVGEGHLIVLGFSPLSLWGFRQKSLPSLRLAPRQAYLTEHRLRDWLGLLGLEAMKAEKYFYSLPVNKQSFVEKASRIDAWGPQFWPFMNGAYMLVAKKCMLRAAIVGPSWHRRRTVVGGLAEPATRTAVARSRSSECPES